MKQETALSIIIALKRFLGLAAGFVWIYVIYTISKSPVPFMEQAPYCMVSTMLIFGIVTILYKGLDRWSLRK